MRHFTFAALLFACGETAAPDPVLTEPVWHLETGLAVVAGEVGPAAVTWAADALGLSGDDGLVVRAVVAGADRLHHVRLKQTYRDVPVLGAEIAVHADDTTFLGYGGTITRNLEGFDVTPAFDGDRALELARAHIAPGMQPVRQARQLAIQPHEGGGAFLVWQVELLADGADGQPGRWFALVDAKSGEVLESFDGLTTAQASGPGGNPKVPRDWSAALDVEPDGGGFAMDTGRLQTIDMHEGDEGGDVVVGPLEAIGDPAINDAHGYAEVTLNAMRDWMGYDSIDNQGFRIVSRVHYMEDYANAFWDGERMTYGDGGDKYYPLSGALDIVAHEIHHGFTEKHSGLVYKKQSGGLNESFSDIAGTIAEFYERGEDGSFEIGEDVIEADAALRYMCNPPYDGSSIDHADDFDDGVTINDLRLSGTDVHYSSGIGNKAFCLAVARYRVNVGSDTVTAVRAVGEVWYLANAGYWTSESNFSQGCQGTVDAAHALGFTSDAVVGIHQSWADVGVYCESGEGLACDADGDCDADESCFTCATDCGSCTESCSAWKKAKCKLGIGDCDKCTDAGGCGNGECDDDEDDENCGIDCGCRAPDGACGEVAPYGCWCDEYCGDYEDCCADLDVCL